MCFPLQSCWVKVTWRTCCRRQAARRSCRDPAVSPAVCPSATGPSQESATTGLSTHKYFFFVFTTHPMKKKTLFFLTCSCPVSESIPGGELQTSHIPAGCLRSTRTRGGPLEAGTLNTPTTTPPCLQSVSLQPLIIQPGCRWSSNTWLPLFCFCFVAAGAAGLPGGALHPQRQHLPGRHLVPPAGGVGPVDRPRRGPHTPESQHDRLQDGSRLHPHLQPGHALLPHPGAARSAWQEKKTIFFLCDELNCLKPQCVVYSSAATNIYMRHVHCFTQLWTGCFINTMTSSFSAHRVNMNCVFLFCLFNNWIISICLWASNAAKSKIFSGKYLMTRIEVK